jgi:hypothetical protein
MWLADQTETLTAAQAMAGEEIAAQIVAKGDEIRDLKKAKAEKAVIDAKVAELLALKNSYKAVPALCTVTAARTGSFQRV